MAAKQQSKHRLPHSVVHCGECNHPLLVGPRGASCRNKHCPQHAVVFSMADGGQPLTA